MRKFAVTLIVLAAALPTAGCFGGKKDVSEYLARAEQFQASGDLEKAKLELRNAVKVNPRDPKANLALAKIEDQAGDLQAAVPHYVVAAAPEARLIEPQLRIVQILLDSGRYAEATGRINTTLGTFPDSADALALRADLYERQGQIALARTDAGAALRKEAANPRALAVMAMLALRDNNTTEAIALVDRGLQKDAKDLRLLQVRAAALLTMNQPDKAVEALKTIVRTAPRNVVIQTALAQIEAENGHLDDAIANFRNAVTENPSNTEMQLAFVKFLAEQNKSGDVIAYLRKLIAANPKANVYDIILAEYYRSNGQIAEAGKVLDDAAGRLKEGPEFLDIQVDRAKRQALLGHVDQASRDIDAVLAADPQNEEALLFRATLDTDNGRVAAAVTNLLKVVRSNPVSARAFQLLASSYLSLGQPRMAVDAMQRAVAVAPNDTGAQVKLAAFLQRAGQVDEARGLMSRLMLQLPNVKEVWVANGELAVDRKDWQAVARSIARLRELPDSNTLVLSLDAASKAAQGDNAGAAKNYQAVIAAGAPIDPGLFGAFARASAASGDAAGAADFIEQHLAPFKDAALQQAWTAVMTLRADAGQFDRADAAFQKAAALTPTDVSLYTTYLRILVAQKQLAPARQVIAKGLAAGANRTALLLLSGGLDELAGDPAAAMKAYKDALASNPLSREAANNYGSMLADQDPKNLSALQEVRDALNGAESGGDPSVLDTMAWLDYRLGRIDEAKRLLDQANAGQSANPQIRFHLAAVMLAAGDRAGGLALLDSVKGLNFPGADEARTLSAT